jgi:hypothetical protein
MLELLPMEDTQAMRLVRMVRLHYSSLEALPWSFSIVDGLGNSLITSNQAYKTAEEAQEVGDWALLQL